MLGLGIGLNSFSSGNGATIIIEHIFWVSEEVWDSDELWTH